ncbi:MAG: threonine/serine exporter family protein [Clostridia bacterium]|nr:threonine/serine exporter family protein [Clostridia bacterium]
MQYKKILDNILDAGEILLIAGAEVSRVEDTIRRMSAAYGFIRTDVFTITSSVMVTVHLENGETLSQIRRIKTHQTDMQKIEAVNALSRTVCASPIPADELQKKICNIKHEPQRSAKQQLAAYVIVAFAFSIFFGGKLRDGIAAAICSVVLFGIIYIGNRIHLQPIILTILASAMMCASAFLTVWCGMGNAVDKIIIGNIMLLIPGVALMSSVRDMILGDTISGLLGMCEAILRAVAIAIGCALVLMQLGGNI